MMNAILQSFVVQGAAYVVTQAFANRLALLCQQAYYNPYAREALNRQIAAEIYNAFSNSPVYAHEQMASNLLSALLRHPIAAGQLRLLGPHQCASQYPMFAPVIYSIADVLMPGWNGTPRQVSAPVLSVDWNQQSTQSTSPQPFHYSGPSPSTYYPQTSAPSLTPTTSPYVTQPRSSVNPRSSSIPVSQPLQQPLPFRTQKSWQTSPPTRSEVERNPRERESTSRLAKGREVPQLGASHIRTTQLGKSSGPSSTLDAATFFDNPCNLPLYSAKSPEEKRAFKEALLTHSIERGNALDKRMEELCGNPTSRADEPRSAAEEWEQARIQERMGELKRGFLADTENRNKVADAAIWLLNNPGPKTSDLKNVVDPFRECIRAMAGDGIIEQLDSVLAQETTESETDVRQLPSDLTRNDRFDDPDEGEKGVQEKLGSPEESDWKCLEWETKVHIGAGPGEDSAARDEKRSRLGRNRGIFGPDPSDREYNLSSQREGDENAIIEISKHVRQLQGYRKSAQWEQSQAYSLFLTLEQRLHPEIALELGRNLFFQGNIRIALEVADSSWLRWKYSWHDQSILNALRLARAFFKYISDCELKQALEEALAIQKADDDLDGIEMLSEVKVTTEFFYYKILKLAMWQGLLDNETFKPLVRKRVQNLASLLHDAGRNHEAISFSIFLVNETESIQEKEIILQAYVYNPSVLLIDKVRVWVELVDVFANAKIVSRAEYFRRKAEEGFTELGQIAGELQMQLKRLELVDPKTKQDVKGMLNLADDFENLHYPAGRINALCSAQSAAFGLYAKEDVLKIYELIQKACSQTGNEFVRQQQESSVSLALVSWSEHIGKGIQGLHGYVEAASKEAPGTKGQMAMVLGATSTMLGDQEGALKYSKVAVDTLKRGGNYEALSDARLIQANVMTSGEVNADFDAAIEMLEQSLEQDVRHDYIEGLARKLDTLITLEGTLAIGDQSGYHQKRQDHWATERDKISVPISRSDAIERARRYLMMKEFGKAEAIARETLKTYTEKKDLWRAAQCQHLLLSCNYRSLDLSSYSPELPQKVSDILRQAKITAEAYQELGSSSIPLSFTIEISMALEELGRYLPKQKSELYHEALKYLDLGESVSDSTRKDLPSSSGLAALELKRTFVGYKFTQEIYQRALRLAFATNDAETLWKWTQMAKARALSDMVASRLVSLGSPPTELMEDEQAVALMEEEARILKELESATQFQSTSIRIKLDWLHASMEDHFGLGNLLRARTGKMELQDLDWIFGSSMARELPENCKIVLVDWVVIDNAIVMLTVDASLKPLMTVLDLSWMKVSMWKRKNLASEKPLNNMEDFKNMTLELNGLVSGLAKSSAAGDLLVLCPSTTLHTIPLHALKIGRKSLIERNLIVYTSSLSLLRQSCHRAQRKAEHRLGTLRAAFFGVLGYEAPYGSDKYWQDQQEREKIYECVTPLAATFGSEPNLGVDASKTRFCSSARDVDILHYHGHMDTHPNVLCQSLRLSDGETTSDPAEKDELASSVDVLVPSRPPHGNAPLTVREIFALRLDLALAIIVACGSGVQDVAAGDEPLGLLAALQYAGTATAVGTLWPVDSPDGRVFETAFFRELAAQWAQVRPGARGSVSVVVAFCTAVRELKAMWDVQFGGTPFHWAAFVLCGAWFM